MITRPGVISSLIETKSVPMTDNLIVIAKEEIPSGTFSPMIKPPVFGDLREARKRFPYPASNTAPNVGYTVEELLFALSFVGVNGQQFPVDGRDVIERIQHMTIEDKQYIMVAFIEAFYLGPTGAKKARTLAQNLSLGSGSRVSYVIGKEHFPSGKHTVTFARPNVALQMKADRAHQGPEVNGCSLEDMLMAMSITHVDGSEVLDNKDAISMLDSWDIEDVQFASLLFVNMFTIDDTQNETAKDLGKQLRQRSGQPKPAPKEKATSTPTPATPEDTKS
jgi:hypothetical protein